MKGLSRLVKILSEYSFIIALVLILVFLLFAAVNSSVPPRTDPRERGNGGTTMTEPLTLERMVSVIEKQGVVVDQEITEETHFADLNVDSLDRVELQFAVENEIGEDLTVAEKELDEVRTVGDLMRVVNTALDDAS